MEHIILVTTIETYSPIRESNNCLGIFSSGVPFTFTPVAAGKVIVFPRSTQLVPSSSTMVYCFIRWVTFLGVFKKRESLCLFAGSFKTVPREALSHPLFESQHGTSVRYNLSSPRRRNFPR